MPRAIIALLVCVALAVPVAAQVVPTPVFPADVFYLEVNAANEAAADAMTANIDIDGKVVVQGQAMICGPAPDSPPPSVWHPCETAIPTLAPGRYSVRIQVAEMLYGRPLLSAWSDPIVIDVLVRKVVRNFTVRPAEFPVGVLGG